MDHKQLTIKMVERISKSLAHFIIVISYSSKRGLLNHRRDGGRGKKGGGKREENEIIKKASLNLSLRAVGVGSANFKCYLL